MERLVNLVKKILVILAIGAAVLVIGTAGQTDHDEYIEVNSTPKVRVLN